MGRFERKYPETSIWRLIGSSQQVSEWIEDKRVEVGVIGAQPGRRALAASPLMDDEMVVA